MDKAVELKNFDKDMGRMIKRNDKVRSETKKQIALSTLAIHNQARRKVPVAEGRLKSSIAIDIRDRGLTSFIGTNVKYAVWVEEGTRRQRAQPYLQPAFDKEEKVFIKKIKEIVKREMRKK